MASKSRLAFFTKMGHAGGRSRDCCSIVIMGAENVGKTALIVRFLTKKYLSEYSHGGVTSYERNICLDNKILTIRVTDTSGKESFTSLKSKGLLDGADGFIVVYSITDKRSFFKAKELLRLLQADYGSEGKIPMTLIGNKDDLVHLRAVSTLEGQRIGLQYPLCTFCECSAAREAQNVNTAFQDFLRAVVQAKDGKRPSLLTPSLSQKSPNPRRNSAGNSTLSSWWRRTRVNSDSPLENRQDRTFTM